MLSVRSLPVLSICDVGVLWPNGWTDQDETWHAARPWRLCVRWGPSPLNFRPMFIIVIVISLEHCTMHCRLVCSSSSFSILCILFLDKKSLLVLNLLQYKYTAQLHHIAQIAEVGVAN